MYNLRKQYPLLSREEERRLGRLAISGDNEARNTLILSNVSLACNEVKKFLGRLDYEDAIQTAIEGLISGIDRWDPERGVRLSTYAVYWIKRWLVSADLYSFLLKARSYPVCTQFRILPVIIEKFKSQGLSVEDAIKKSSEERGISEDQAKIVYDVATMRPESLTTENGRECDIVDDGALVDKRLHERLFIAKILNIANKSVESATTQLKIDVINALIDDWSRALALGDPDELSTLKEIGERVHCSKENVRLVQEWLFTRVREEFSSESDD